MVRAAGRALHVAFVVLVVLRRPWVGVQLLAAWLEHRSTPGSPPPALPVPVRWRVVAALTMVAVCAVACTASSASSARADTGPWAWPLDGPPPVGRDFAPPEIRYGAGHRGVDLLGTEGEPVRAAGDGTVSYAGLLAGRGVVVVVHGALRTTYEPVAAAVSVGDPVAAGDVLGALEVGHLGCPVAACLHWGLRRGEDYLDPLRLVQRRPPRLLPLGEPLGEPAGDLPVGAPSTGTVPGDPVTGAGPGGGQALRDGGLVVDPPRDGPPGAVPGPLRAAGRSASGAGAPEPAAARVPGPAGPSVPLVGLSAAALVTGSAAAGLLARRRR